jgi:hypothetical protein
MSSDRHRKAGAPAFPRREPTLRLVRNPDERPRPEPDLELKATLDDMNRRYRVQRGRMERDSGGNDAA